MTVKEWTGYLDGALKQNLDLAKRIIEKDWDMVFCVDGYEGSGKSVMAQQCAKYCDPTFNIERVCFTPEEFMKCITSAERLQSIVYDEAYEGMNSRSAMTEVNKTLMGALAEIRQKNLFVFIVLPCFFELDKYAAVWRSRALIHVYTSANFERGFFSFYAPNKKKALYMLGKKFYSYSTPKPDFKGRFTKGYAVDGVEYRARKLRALKSKESLLFKRPGKRETRVMEQRNIAIIKLIKDGMSKREIGELLGLDYTQINTISKQFEKHIEARVRVGV